MPTVQCLTSFSESCRKIFWSHAAGPASPTLPTPPSLQVSLRLNMPSRHCLTLLSDPYRKRLLGHLAGPASPASPHQNSNQLQVSPRLAMPSRQCLTLLSEPCRKRFWSHAAGPTRATPKQRPAAGFTAPGPAISI